MPILGSMLSSAILQNWLIYAAGPYRTFGNFDNLGVDFPEAAIQSEYSSWYKNDGTADLATGLIKEVKGRS